MCIFRNISRKFDLITSIYCFGALFSPSGMVVYHLINLPKCVYNYTKYEICITYRAKKGKIQTDKQRYTKHDIEN